MTAKPGDVADVTLTLQNMVGNEEVILLGSIEEGAEFASLTDENLKYVVPFGSKDVKVNVRISIPEDALPGETLKVGVSLKQLTEQEGKMVQMGGGVKTVIPIVIESPTTAVAAEVEKNPVFSGLVIAVILSLMLIIAAVAVYFAIRKKEEA